MTGKICTREVLTTIKPHTMDGEDGRIAFLSRFGNAAVGVTEVDSAVSWSGMEMGDRIGLLDTRGTASVGRAEGSYHHSQIRLD